MRQGLAVLGAVVVIAAIIIVVIVLAKPASAPSQTTATTSNKSSGTYRTLPGGLKVQDQTVGTGAVAKDGDTITVSYTGTLANGTVFDSTAKDGGQPATFQLVQGQLIDGWVQGIPGMKVGGTRKLIIPPSLAYGANGQGPIPPNATLTFVIQLLKIGA